MPSFTATYSTRFPVAPSGSQCFKGTNLSSSGHRPCPPPCRWMLPLLGRAKLRVSLHRSILGHGQLEHGAGWVRRFGDSEGDMDTLDILLCVIWGAKSQLQRLPFSHWREAAAHGHRLGVRENGRLAEWDRWLNQVNNIVQYQHQ